MDELLSFMEEDFDGPDDLNCSSNAQSSKSLKSCNESEGGSTSHSPPGIDKEKKDLTFKDVFGSPDKRDVKEFGLSSSSTRDKDRSSIISRTSLQSSSVSSYSNSSKELQLHKAIQRDTNVPHRPDNPPIVIDPFSRVRLLKSSISIYFDETVSPEAVLKERNIGLEFVSLPTFPSWCRGKGKDSKNFWISACLVRKTPGVRKSAKGNDYCIWELNDLKDFDRKVSVFLFGSSSSASNLLATPVGALIDITTPAIMPDTSGTGGGAIKLSISNATQVRFIGTAKDFGFCQAKKKDGNKCTAVVNTWECSYCIHHASGELKKLNIGNGKYKKGKGGANGFFPNKTFSGGSNGESHESLKQQGIVVADFGRPTTMSLNRSLSSSQGGSSKTKKPTPVMPPSSRMELQGPNNEMQKNSIKFGNPDTVTFAKKDKDHVLLKNEKPVLPPRKPLDLNPAKTRHLTDKDRDLLRMLDSDSLSKPTPSASVADKEDKASQSKSNAGGSGSRVMVSEIITSSIVNNPNAASRNFMQYLTLQHAPKDQVDVSSKNKSTTLQPLVMSREKVRSMAKALNFVKKNGPLQKCDPNAVSGRKRKAHQLSLGESGSSPSSSTEKAGPSTKKRAGSKAKIDVEFDFESEDFKKILNAKSAHDDELDEIQHEEYFSKLEKKEALENKLLNTFSIETNAVMCRQCKYVALSQSEFCKEQMHEVRLVKARKRFFKCKDCGNRTMSLDRLPKRPCANCNNSSWLAAPVGKERKGPTLPSEMLSVRGHEEKFTGSSASKMYLHLEM